MEINWNTLNYSQVIKNRIIYSLVLNNTLFCLNIN